MLQLKWHSVTITTNQQANDMLKLVTELMPEIGAFDTETTGLHIIHDKPFVYQFGFIHPNMTDGYTYAVDIERQPQLAMSVLRAWLKIAERFRVYLGHHITFDMHMNLNIGLKYETENVSDTMFYIRYAHDAVTPKYGGPPLGLKDYATRFIDPHAKRHENELDREKSMIAKELNLKLKQRLRVCGKPPEKYRAQSYTLSVIEEMFKDPIFDYTDLEPEIKTIYLEWLNQDVPLYLQKKVTGIVESDQIRYDTLNRENLLKYAHYDIIYTLETYLKTAPAVEARGNEAGVEFENKLIYPLIDMERVGFAIDVEYLEASRIRLKNYIKERRQLFYDLAQQEVKVGQSELILEILRNEFNLPIPSTNADILDERVNDLKRNDPGNPAILFIQILQELRTLEKWYSTYIMRFIHDAKAYGRLYTSIHQVGTVSGRVTSDFQQFPKEGITTHDGQELFYPRKLVKISGGDYDGLVYLDYSQIELRFQALYTILIGHPDLNLCRAYMPYECVNLSGEVFDPTNPTHIKSWDQEWFYREDPDTRWTPTDVHGATTEKATGLTKADPEFKLLRSVIGKRVNFAKNYGAKYDRIKQMFPDKSEEEVHRIDDAYYQAFPGVKFYHQYCYDRAQMSSFTTNLFGVRYYNVNGHKLINMLIQGSAAFYLKWKIRQLWEYSKAHNVKSKLQMQIHDELSWEKHKDEFEIFFEFKQIMEDWTDALVPIVAEMDASATVWANKKGVHSLDDLRSRFSV